MKKQQTLIRTEQPKPVPPPQITGKDDVFPIPAYLKSVYHRDYFVRFLSGFYQDSWTANLSTCFQIGRLIKNVTDEIRPDLDVLQLGLTAGNLERAIAEKMNLKGNYHIEDISDIQIAAGAPKVAPWLNAKMKLRDFTVPTAEKYDVVVLFFTLHELPDPRKKEVIARALAALKPLGKIVFIDYSMPCNFHPMKHLVRLYNRLYEPFAESLWHAEIESFAPKSDKLIWAKKTFFGGLYQSVIAQKK